jgi:hypothetical protein
MRQDFGFLPNRLDQPKLLFSSLDFTISRLSGRSRLYHESEINCKTGVAAVLPPRISLKHYGSGRFEVDGQVYQPYMPEETDYHPWSVSDQDTAATVHMHLTPGPALCSLLCALHELLQSSGQPSN